MKWENVAAPCPVAIGARVRVTGVQPNDPDPLPIGSTGTVTGGNGEQVWVDWDSGRTLILLVDDPYEVLVTQTQSRSCRHCGRDVVLIDGAWIDPEAPTDTDDVIWRETCDASPDFTADHEPEEIQ